ncbi:MAG: 2-oxo acid dehydrogenase subunit E2 [Dehalococcoidia bacterium]|nr:2-oxo acid dehydrogenase subunit E2 [Dehalococcoidia bacterium]
MPVVEMPQLGESVTEGTVLQWFKEPGDAVAVDEPLCEIETEKVTAELPSPYAGRMGEIHVSAGETVEVGAPLCSVETAESDVPSAGAAPPATSAASGGDRGGWTGGPMAIPPDERTGPAPASPEPTASSASASVRAGPRPAPQRGTIAVNPEPRTRFYSPAVNRLAAQHQIDLSGVKGTGIDGRITRRDIERLLERGDAATGSEPTSVREQDAPSVQRPGSPSGGVQSPGGRDYETVPLSATRRTIANRMQQSNLEAPQAWTMVEVDMSQVFARRADDSEAAEAAGARLTLLPYFTAAVVATLREFPALNARWDGDELRRYHRFHIGIAVASDHGLIVPVVKDAGDLSVVGLARQIADLAERARARKLTIDEIEGGTFTVNNTGTFGSVASKPIVNHPQVAIVTLERVVRRPVVVGGDAIAIRPMANVCLSFDHRALDGDEAGGFLAALKERLETGEGD